MWALRRTRAFSMKTETGKLSVTLSDLNWEYTYWATQNFPQPVQVRK